VAQAVECLPSEHEALISTPQYHQKKKKEEMPLGYQNLEMYPSQSMATYVFLHGWTLTS
jgi:hypothetical protein